MNSCVFPGSFDPITCGHLNLIERAAGMFDHVTVAVMINLNKTGTIPFPDRAEMIRKACRKIQNVDVVLWEGLLAEYMRDHSERIVIRSVRNTAEFEQEYSAAAANRRLFPEMETIFLPAAPEWADISSSAVREIAAFGGSIRGLVPSDVYRDIMKQLKTAAAKK